jgi:hypothetical protein
MERLGDSIRLAMLLAEFSASLAARFALAAAFD